VERGEMKWIDQIVIKRDEVSKKPVVEVNGLWNGADRIRINNLLRKAMRKAKNEIVKQHRQAVPIVEEAVEVKPTKADIMAKARAAKKLKKELEEAKKDVRGQK